jgi:hypothetical protein
VGFNVERHDVTADQEKKCREREAMDRTHERSSAA